MRADYTLNPWESFELLKDLLKRFFSVENYPVELKKIEDSVSINTVLNYGKEFTSEIAFSIQKAKYGKTYKDYQNDKNPGTDTKNRNKFGGISYTLSNSIKKSSPIIISKGQFHDLLSYLGREDEIESFGMIISDFNPDYGIRKRFSGTEWKLYNWDFASHEENKTVDGIRLSHLFFLNTYKVKLITYKINQDRELIYWGTYEPYKQNFLKIRLTINPNDNSEEDVSFVFFVSDNIVTLALGQYRSVDGVTINCGSAIIESINKGEKVVSSFTPFSKKPEFASEILQFLREKNKNYFKITNSVLSIKTLQMWLKEKEKQKQKDKT